MTIPKFQQILHQKFVVTYSRKLLYFVLTQVLDFAKLESDILKNVLGEEEKRLEKKKEESNDIFPSFNYIPPPIPHSFLKYVALFMIL